MDTSATHRYYQSIIKNLIFLIGSGLFTFGCFWMLNDATGIKKIIAYAGIGLFGLGTLFLLATLIYHKRIYLEFSPNGLTINSVFGSKIFKWSDVSVPTTMVVKANGSKTYMILFNARKSAEEPPPQKPEAEWGTRCPSITAGNWKIPELKMHTSETQAQHLMNLFTVYHAHYSLK